MLRSKLVDIAYADVLAFVQSYCLRMFDPTRCYSREFDESLFLLLKLGVIGIGFLLLRFSPRCPSKIRSSGHSENLLPGGCAGSKAISWLACLSVLIVMSGASSLLVLLRRFRKRRIRCQGRSRKNLIVDVEPKPRRQRVAWICGLKHWPLRIVSSVAGLRVSKNNSTAGDWIQAWARCRCHKIFRCASLFCAVFCFKKARSMIPAAFRYYYGGKRSRLPRPQRRVVVKPVLRIQVSTLESGRSVRHLYGKLGLNISCRHGWMKVECFWCIFMILSLTGWRTDDVKRAVRAKLNCHRNGDFESLWSVCVRDGAQRFKNYFKMKRVESTSIRIHKHYEIYNTMLSYGYSKLYCVGWRLWSGWFARVMVMFFLPTGQSCDGVLLWCFFDRQIARVQFPRLAQLLDAFDTALCGWSTWRARVVAVHFSRVACANACWCDAFFQAWPGCNSIGRLRCWMLLIPLFTVDQTEARGW